MARDLADKGKMPSLTVISMGKGKPGSDQPDPTSQSDDMGKESYFKCPACGTRLCAEEKGESDAGQSDDGGDEAPMARGGYGA